MGLQDCAEKKIGNWHLRGISTGEKRRLSIGVEILTQPKVLFLDEPTSGLDSASAFFVLLVLNSIAHDGRIVVCSIHQPSSHLFDLFDDLLLLSNGETIYFGDAKLAVKFFAEAGFPCPTRRNPSDHFLRCINSDFDKISTSPLPSQRQSKRSKQNLSRKYKDSDISKNIRKRVQELALSEQVEIVSNKSDAGWWKQLWTLSGRSFLNMSRDMGYYWSRTLFYILVSVKCRQSLFQHRNILSIHTTKSKFPLLVVLSTSSGTIIYYMVKLHPGISRLAYFCINLFCCISILETCMMWVALLVPNVLMGIGVGTCVVMLMMMASEMFKPDLPKFFWHYPMSYISFASWAIQGQYKNDMIGIEFDPQNPGDKKVKGEEVLQKIFGMELELSKWWDLLALLVLLVSHRLILLAALKYKEKSLSLLRRLYASHFPTVCDSEGEVIEFDKGEGIQDDEEEGRHGDEGDGIHDDEGKGIWFDEGDGIHAYEEKGRLNDEGKGIHDDEEMADKMMRKRVDMAHSIQYSQYQCHQTIASSSHLFADDHFILSPTIDQRYGGRSSTSTSSTSSSSSSSSSSSPLILYAFLFCFVLFLGVCLLRKLRKMMD
ncbi:hypothetical protein LWI28_023245 [Acer negundo]|uniref:Uncharacterized protein n=1 Tax=Acer negundo TaxID=4023 RepID=A0AAD5IG19_ACENE|nr:hypothetical protein LWI28_023245 [Acer negundo]